MNDDEIRSNQDGPADPEGVRILGADEAERALERDDVVRRREPGAPRLGDRPGRPPSDAPEPVLRFPLSSSAGNPEPAADLPHWSDPPTGEYQAVSGNLFDEEPPMADDNDWTSFTAATPRWRDSDDGWTEADDVRTFGDDNTRMGALDDSDRPDPDDFFSFDELDEPLGARSVFNETDIAVEDDLYYDDDTADVYYEDEVDDSRKIVVGGGRVTAGGGQRSRAPREPRDGGGVGGDRDLGQAAIVGVGFVVAAFLAFFISPVLALLLVVGVVTMASAELFTKLREIGYEPAALLGIAGTAGMVLAAYHRGEGGIALAMFLVVVGTMVWFLVGAGTERPTINIGVTLLGVAWVGMFGSYAGALLGVQGGAGIGDAGKGILFGAILATAGHDVGGYFVGRSVGKSPLSAASPNKSVEGLIGGCLSAVIVAVIYGALVQPLGSLTDGLVLGLTVAVAAPVGDLCQSMIKRDLGIKDMGSILPGHGGLMDRFDALLFVLPCVYYSARFFDFFLQ